MIRIASPFDLAKALMARAGADEGGVDGPENSASVAAPPALKMLVLRLTSGPSLSAKIPFSTPAMAAAWVTLGK